MYLSDFLKSLLRLARDVVRCLDDRSDVLRCIAGICCIGAIGDPDDVRAGVPKASDQALYVRNQQVLYSVESVLRGLDVALLGQQFAQSHLAIACGVLHIND